VWRSVAMVSVAAEVVGTARVEVDVENTHGKFSRGF
jgi:hypothetical protein